MESGTGQKEDNNKQDQTLFALVRLWNAGAGDVVRVLAAAADSRRSGTATVTANQTRASSGRRWWRTGRGFRHALSPFLIGRMFLREPSWKYSVKLFGS